jgi:16S rRNA (cytosine1402-N4)-methyltransferase
MLKEYHKPVLEREVLDALGLGSIAHLNNAGKYIDATLGHAGHSIVIAKTGSSVLGIEADEDMILIAKERIDAEHLGENIKIANGNFRDIDKIAGDKDYSQVDGILFDLGISSYHYTQEERGFSFKDPEAELDMRLNAKEQGVKASELLNVLREDQLFEMFYQVLGRNEARKLCKVILRTREEKPFKTVGDIIRVVDRVGGIRSGRIHPATKVFLALRIAVNGELDNINEALPKAFGLLKKGGKIAVISFHSLEDSIVKKYFSNLVKMGVGKYSGAELIKPTETEVTENPLSRSAVLRVIEKI